MPSFVLRFGLSLTLLAVAAVIAVWRGGWPERSVAAILIAWVAVDQAFHFLFPSAEAYHSVDLWHLCLDVVALIAFLAIALVAERLWTLWLCSAQLLAVVGHVLRLIDAGMDGIVYAIFIRAPFWVAILLLLWGSSHMAWRRGRDRALGGSA